MQARVEWDAEKIQLLGEIREEKQAARRAARDKEAVELENARLSDRIESLDGRLEAAEEAATLALEHSSMLDALLVDASALYGRLNETSIDRSTYEALRSRTTELERDLSTAQARLLPLRVSRQHQKDLVERVSTLEDLLIVAETRADDLQATLRSLIDDSPAPRLAVQRPPLDAFLSGETTASCYAAKAALDATLCAHLVDRAALLERRSRDLSTVAFDNLLASSALTDELSSAVSSLEAAQLKLQQAENAIDLHGAEQASSRTDMAALRSREGDARAALASLSATHATSEAERSALERELRLALRRVEEALGTERDTVKRLASALGQSKVAQESMRSDFDK